jgi:hypothetical protein
MLHNNYINIKQYIIIDLLFPGSIDQNDVIENAAMNSVMVPPENILAMVLRPQALRLHLPLLV